MKTKNALRVFAIGAILAGAVTLTSCKKDETANSIILKQNGQAVTEDFSLISKYNGEDVSWTSNNDKIQIIETEADGNKTITAAVFRNVTDETSVTLTASMHNGKSKKEFNVKINPVDVYEIAEAYEFSKSGSIVYGTFGVDDKFTYNLTNAASTEPYAKLEATISWSSSSDLISINGTTATVTDQQEKVAAKINATFKYNDLEVTKKYSVNVWHELTDEEWFRYFYDNVGKGDTFTIEGYVLAKAGYTTSGATLYVYDKSLKGSYYIYNTSMKEDAYNSLTVGQKVKITGATNTSYNGLIETNKGSTCEVVEGSIDISTISPIALDEPLLFGDELKYMQNSMATLTSWKIKSIGNASATGTAGTQTLLVLEKEGKTTSVVINKYLTDLKGDVATQIFNTVKELKVGDYINVSGFVTVYNAYQIVVDKATSIVKTENDNGASTPNYNKFKEAYAAYNEFAKAITEATTVNLAAAYGDVNVTYALKGTPTTATLENGVLTFNPTDTEETVTLVWTLVCGDRTVTLETEISVKLMNEQEKAEYEMAQGLEETYTNSQKVTLPTTGTKFDTVTNITYELAEGTLNAAIVDGVLYLAPTAEEQTVTVNAKAYVGETAYEKQLTFKMQEQYDTYDDFEALCTATTASTNTATIKGVLVGTNSNSKNLYVEDLTDSTKGYYIYSSIAYTDVKLGTVVYITMKGQQYTQSGDGSVTVIEGSSPVVQVAYNLDGTVKTANPSINQPTAYDTDGLKPYLGTLVSVSGNVTKIDGTDIYMTVNDTEVKVSFVYLSKEDQAKVKAAEFVGATVTFNAFVGYYKVPSLYLPAAEGYATITTPATDANKVEIVEDEVKKMFDENYSKNKEITLTQTSSLYQSVNYAYTVTSGTSAVITNDKLVITPTDTEETVTLKVTATSGEATKDYTVTFKTKLPAAEVQTVTASYTGSNTTNMSGDSNNAATIGLDATLFNVTSTLSNGGNTHVGLNKSHFMRFYSNHRVELGIEITSGAIDSISLDIRNGSFVVATSDGTVITPVDGKYTVNDTKVIIYTSDGSNRDLNSITINYRA